MFTSFQIEIVRSRCGECERDARGKRGRFHLLFFMLFARFQENLISFFRGMPVAHHGKNPVWFVFHCTNKLQSQPIGLPKIFIDYFFFQADQWDCTKSVSIFKKNVEIRTFFAKFVALEFFHSWFRMAC